MSKESEFFVYLLEHYAAHKGLTAPPMSRVVGMSSD